MKIAVLSGKGGTGKTTFSVNLQYILRNYTLIDADIEEPNSHLFFELKNIKTNFVTVNYPEVTNAKCTLCGECGKICSFNAIIPAKRSVLVFKESCHDCGGCKLVCKYNAITYKKRDIGEIFFAETNLKTKLIYGKLNIGELSGVSIIKELNKFVQTENNIIIDCPPGAACSTLTAVEMSDYAVIVSEPTPFGVSDMKIIVELLRELNKPFGVVVNKSGIGNNEIYEYCNSQNIKIIGEIPFMREIAINYSKGQIISEFINDYYENIKAISITLIGESNENK